MIETIPSSEAESSASELARNFELQMLASLHAARNETDFYTLRIKGTNGPNSSIQKDGSHVLEEDLSTEYGFKDTVTKVSPPRVETHEASQATSELEEPAYKSEEATYEAREAIYEAAEAVYEPGEQVYSEFSQDEFKPSAAELPSDTGSTFQKDYDVGATEIASSATPVVIAIDESVGDVDAPPESAEGVEDILGDPDKSVSDPDPPPPESAQGIHLGEEALVNDVEPDGFETIIYEDVQNEEFALATAGEYEASPLLDTEMEAQRFDDHSPNIKEAEEQNVQGHGLASPLHTEIPAMVKLAASDLIGKGDDDLNTPSLQPVLSESFIIGRDPFFVKTTTVFPTSHPPRPRPIELTKAIKWHELSPFQMLRYLPEPIFTAMQTPFQILRTNSAQKIRPWTRFSNTAMRA